MASGGYDNARDAQRIIMVDTGGNGGPYVATVVKPVAAVAITAGTPVTLHAPVAGKKYRVLGFALSLTVAGSVIFKEAGTEKFRTPLMGAGVGIAFENMGQGVLGTTAGVALQLDASANGSVSGFVLLLEE